MAPSDLVSGIVGDVQSELNTVFNLDDHLNDESGGEGADGDDADSSPTTDPVTITVDEESATEE
jgi:hypothetical protein